MRLGRRWGAGSGRAVVAVLFLLVSGGAAVAGSRHPDPEAHASGRKAGVAAQAAAARETLFGALEQARTPEGWIRSNLAKAEQAEIEVWGSSQALWAVFHYRDVSPRALRPFLGGLDAPFAPGRVAVDHRGVRWGWINPGETYPKAEAALCTEMALATALGKPGLLSPAEARRARERLNTTQKLLSGFHPTHSGGWNMLPQQADPKAHSVYSTALALLALLETRRAGLPWEGSTQRRDDLLASTVRWLNAQYEASAPVPGWRGNPQSGEPVSDGLTLQIYGELLRAEEEAHIPLTRAVQSGIEKHLERLATRPADYPLTASEFRLPFTYRGQKLRSKDSLHYFWYPWGVDTAARWLRSARVKRRNPVPAHRALDHLVLEIGEAATRQCVSGYTCGAAEALYGLSAVSPRESLPATRAH